MIKYYPYKSDKPNKNIILLQMIINFVFGATGYSDFTHHKMSSANNYILIDTGMMKIGLNPGLIRLDGGVSNICGHIQQKRKHIIILKRNIIIYGTLNIENNI